ncbi:MAG: thioredoxin [Chloroflexi bacterium]|nr:thioredoxin [Chloroflexota bacterium]
MSERIKHLTDQDFQSELKAATLPLLVDFWAPWCGPCRMIAPVIEELAKEYEGKIAFAKVNTDENPATPGNLGIRGIPTLILFVGGEEHDRMVGFAPKPALQKKLDAVLGGLKG